MSAYTVVIPAYNAAATIVESIDSALRQTVPPQRIIVVDDGSDDETAALVSKYAGKVELIARPHLGPGAASTTGIAEVDSTYSALLDADDLWLPHKADAQLTLLASSDAAGVFCHVASFRGEPESADYSAAVPGWLRTTAFMRTAVAQSALPIVDPPGLRGEMIDWFARIREAGHRLVMMREVLALRRIHPGSLTFARTPQGTDAYLRVAHAALARRRQRENEDGN